MQTGLLAFPFTEPNLCRFVAYLFDTLLSPQSIRHYLSALRFHQIATGGPNPSMAHFHQLQYVLRGINRLHPLATRCLRLPITPAILQLLHHVWSAGPVTCYGLHVAWASLPSSVPGNLHPHPISPALSHLQMSEWIVRRTPLTLPLPYGKARQIYSKRE